MRKRHPKSLKNEMFFFGLHSISDDWLSDPSNEYQPKCEKRPPRSSKNELFIFGLHSISDDQPSNLSDECQPKCKKSPLSPRKMKCSFLDYIQFLMISQAIQAMNINQNAKKGPLSHQKIEMFIFGLHSISDDQLNDLSDEHRPKCEKRPSKSSKNEMLIFGLSSISDDWPSNPSNKS